MLAVCTTWQKLSKRDTLNSQHESGKSLSTICWKREL
jgi:hypothetical protein